MTRRLAAVLGLGLAGSQAGHLLAYRLRFGSSAAQVQSSGAHAYLPTLVKTSLGGIALALLGSLLLIGLARVLSPGSQAGPRRGPGYLSLLATLFTIQLGLYMAQEVTEAMAAGTAAGAAPELLLWGTLGQLPVAFVGAAAFLWLGARVETAVGDLRALEQASTPGPIELPARILVPVQPDRALLMSGVAGSSLAKRGPPSSLEISPF
jgi:hypothetical protein